MNRGSTAQDNVNRGDFIPSMRPRFMNRGSHVCSGSAGRIAPPFNEAPIHESGKSPAQD